MQLIIYVFQWIPRGSLRQFTWEMKLQANEKALTKIYDAVFSTIMGSISWRFISKTWRDVFP